MLKIKNILKFIVLLVFCLFLSGCTKNENNDLNEKIGSELEYLDKEIIGIMNKINNITLDNYQVKERNVESQIQSNSGTEQNNGGSSENNSGQEEGSNNNENSSNIKVMQMQPSNILVRDNSQIDWTTLKSEIELVYTSWNAILIDLYNLDIKKEDILMFGQLLDNAIISVKTENKVASLAYLANLYAYLPLYAEKIEIEESEKNLYKTKSNLLNAYALVEQDNWTEIENQLNLADENYTKIINDVNYIEDKKDNITKVYVLIKELKNSINLRDKDIFYIKYKSIMNSI